MCVVRGCVLYVSHITAVESDLSRELQNGRLFRLLTQLNWITERPQSVTSQPTAPSNHSPLAMQLLISARHSSAVV